MSTEVQGHCPACGQKTLYLRDAGVLICLWDGCPDRYALDKILEDGETAHIVRIGPERWDAQHPLRERVNSNLLGCDIAEGIAELFDHPPSPEEYGVYRVQRATSHAGWSAEPIEGSTHG